MKRTSDHRVDLFAPSGDEQEGGFSVSPSTEAWIERMMRAGERMHRDEDYRRKIARRLS